LVRRDLRNVRLYTNPVASLLGAEAFTTGERVVMAPGRLNPRSPQGLALLGHELTHVGLPLAFKQLDGTTPVPQDAEERAAQQQEHTVRRIIEKGWPEPMRMDLRVPPSTTGQPDTEARTESPTSSRSLEGVTLIRGSAPDSVQRTVTVEQPVTTAHIQRHDIVTGAQSAAPDLDKLARQVYDILKTRLRAERERHPFYPH
jgi:hypothetical protein